MEIRSGVFGRLKTTQSFKRIEPSHIRTRSAFHYGHEVSFIAPGAFYVQWHAGRGRKLVEIRSGVFGRLKSTRSFKRIELSHTRCVFHHGHKVLSIADVKCHSSRRGHSTYSGMLDAGGSWWKSAAAYFAA